MKTRIYNIYARGHEIWPANPDWTDEEINETVAEEFGLTAEEVDKGNRLVLPIPTASSGVLRSHLKQAISVNTT